LKKEGIGEYWNPFNTSIILLMSKNRPVGVLISLLLFCLPAFAQVESPFKIIGSEASIDQILSERIQYPSEGLSQRMKGEVLFSVKINREGNFDSLIILESTHAIFQTESLKALAYLESNWYPDLLQEKTLDRRYLIYFKFDTFLNEASPSDLLDRAAQLIRKEKFDKALKVTNKVILELPYSVKAHELRWEVFRNLEQTENAQRDYLKAKYLKKEFLAIVEVFAVGKVRVPGPFSN
jgi:tetratricopeptide (TPR) repeat protein